MSTKPTPSPVTPVPILSNSVTTDKPPSEFHNLKQVRSMDSAPTQVVVNSKAVEPAASDSFAVSSSAIDIEELLKNKQTTPGGSQPLQLIFKDIGLDFKVAPDKSKGEKFGSSKSILRDCTGVLHPGRVCAILGASGAGKTSLIQLISRHRTWPAKNVAKESGVVMVNGEIVTDDKLRTICAFVYQDDVMYTSLTVREHITLAAMLRLPKEMPKEEKLQRVEDVIDMLALRRCAETRVGTGKIFHFF